MNEVLKFKKKAKKLLIKKINIKNNFNNIYWLLVLLLI